MSEEPDYGGGVRWLTVDTEIRQAVGHYYDVGADEEGILTERIW